MGESYKAYNVKKIKIYSDLACTFIFNFRQNGIGVLTAHKIPLKGGVCPIWPLVLLLWIEEEGW